MKSVVVKNILHIDDDAEIHEIFSDALQEVSDDLNYHPLTDAKEALDRLRDKKLTPDVIFLDLNMPKMNGQEFLAEVKNCSTLSTIPVVVFSTSTHMGTIEFMKRLGAKGFATKPESYSELIKALSSILSGN